MIKNELLKECLERYELVKKNINLWEGNIEKFILEDVEFLVKNNLYSIMGEYNDASIFSQVILNDISKVKQYSYLCGIATVLSINCFDNSEHLHIQSCMQNNNVLLSDNLDLINEYANLKNSNYYSNAKFSPLASCLQALIRDDFEFLEKIGIPNMEKSLLIKKNKIIEPDLNFFLGMMEKNEKKIKDAITILATKLHKTRNREMIFLNNFISVPALTYAKLAWLKGIEVEIDNPLIPKDLLPFKPNKEYFGLNFMKNSIVHEYFEKKKEEVRMKKENYWKELKEKGELKF